MTTNSGGGAVTPSKRRTRTLREAEVHTFRLGEISLHVIDSAGSLWFPAAEVCAAIGLEGYASQHTHRLDDDDLLVLSRGNNTRDVLALFGPKAPSLTLVSESGLYTLVMRSSKEGARPFQDWVTRDILPTIRRTGSYTAPPVTITPAPAPASTAVVPRESAGPIVTDDLVIHRALEAAMRSHAMLQDALLISHRRNEDLLAKVAQLTERDDFQTVMQFKGYKSRWWSNGDTVKLSRKCMEICQRDGITPGIHNYTMRMGDTVKSQKCRVFPLKILEEAYLVIGPLGAESWRTKS